MQISNSPALIGNLEKDAMRAYLGSYHFVEKSAANDQWYAPMISSSFQNLMKVNDVFSDDFRSESWFKSQINFETSIFIFETSRARGKTSRATRNVSVFYSFSGVRKYFDISFQSKHLGYRLFFQGGTVFLRGRWRFELDKEEGRMDVILSRLFQDK